MHAPPTQLVPVGQMLPHDPQFLASVTVLVHTPGAAPHLVGVAVGQSLHKPLVQVAPLAHFVPHAPQFEVSVATSTQTPPHATLPVAQAQTPLVQV